MMGNPKANTYSSTIDFEYEKHLNLSFQWNRWMLKPIGVWPLSHSALRIKKCYYWLIKVVCYGLISFLFVPSSMYVFLEVEDLYHKIKLFGPLIFCLMAFGKYSSLIFHEKDIRECFERIEWDWRNVKYHDDKNIMVVNANFGRRLIIICSFFAYSGFIFYNIAIPISVGKIEAENENFTFVPLVFPFSRLIVDARYSPTNEIIFSVQLLATALVHDITAAVCGLAAMLATHVCGQIEVLMNWLNHLVDGRSDMDESLDARIANVVSLNVRIMKFLTLTEETLQQISFVEFLGCTLDICLIGYYVIMESKSNDITSTVTYIILLISFTFNIFVFCYIGERVAEQCRRIGEVTYMMQWYRLTGKKKLCCVLIIAMSNSMTKLTAGSMIELSMSTFTNVVKTAVAFLNILRAMT